MTNSAQRLRQAFQPEVIHIDLHDLDGYRKPGQKVTDQEFYAIMDRARQMSDDPSAWLVYSYHRNRNAAKARRLTVSASDRARRLPIRWRVASAPRVDEPDRCALTVQWVPTEGGWVDTELMDAAGLEAFKKAVDAMWDDEGNFIGEGARIPVPWVALGSDAKIEEVPDAPPRHDKRQLEDEAEQHREYLAETGITDDEYKAERAREREEAEARQRAREAMTPHEVAINGARLEAMRMGRPEDEFTVSEYLAAMAKVLAKRGLDASDPKKYVPDGFLEGEYSESDNETDDEEEEEYGL
jgi:hypothetical protein